MQSSAAAAAAAAAAATAAATAEFTAGAVDDVEDDEEDDEEGDDCSFLGRRRETGVELNEGVHAAASSVAPVRAESHVVEILFDLALVSMAGLAFGVNLSDPCLETVVAPSEDLATFGNVLSESDVPFDKSSISSVQETEAPFSTMNFIIDDE